MIERISAGGAQLVSVSVSAGRRTVNGAPPTSTLLIDVLGVSAARAYSTRKLRSAYAGSAIRIRRSSDNAEQDIGFAGEDLDTAAITTFVGANDANVVTWYDQSGNADDAVQATAAAQPPIVLGGVLYTRNTKAAPYFNVFSPDSLVSSVATAGKTAGAVAALDFGSTFDFTGVLTTTVTYTAISATTVGNTFAVADLGTPSVDGGGNTMVFNGVLQNVRASDSTGFPSSEPVVIGAFHGGGGSRYWFGWIGEVVLFDTQLSGPNYATLYTNQKTYWGTP